MHTVMHAAQSHYPHYIQHIEKSFLDVNIALTSEVSAVTDQLPHGPSASSKLGLWREGILKRFRNMRVAGFYNGEPHQMWRPASRVRTETGHRRKYGGCPFTQIWLIYDRRRPIMRDRLCGAPRQNGIINGK